MKVIEVDNNCCVGCMACVLACSLIHTKAYSYNSATIKILRSEDAEPCQIRSCSNCTDKSCIEACPFGAIIMNESYAVPMIDYERCKQCGLCVRECSYGIIRIEAGSNKVYKCDFCDGEPWCVQACVPGALKIRDVI